MSVQDHPLTHSKEATVFHELSADALNATHDYLIALRRFNEELELPPEHSLLIIDDFAALPFELSPTRYYDKLVLGGVGKLAIGIVGSQQTSSPIKLYRWSFKSL